VELGEHVPALNELRARAPSNRVLICTGICALILAAATTDLIHTESRLPDASPACEAGSSTCQDLELSEQLARDRAADPLQDQYGSRAWLYSSAILAVVAVATGWGLRSRPRTEWLQVFSNLGAIGVWLGIAAVLLLLATDGSSLAPPPAPTLLIPVGLLGAAAVGTLMGRSEGWSEQGQLDGARDLIMQTGKLAIHLGTAGQIRRSRLDRLARWLIRAALGLTALTCVLVLVSLLGKPDCAAQETTRGWADPLDALAAVTAIGGMAAGIGALLLRRWVAALISLVGCPVALLLVLASTCAFYS
jgi:hypothetical protein